MSPSRLQLAESRLRLQTGGLAQVLPLLDDHLPDLFPRDAEPLDQNLAELLIRLLLDLERKAHLELGRDATLDEERADQAGRD